MYTWFAQSRYFRRFEPPICRSSLVTILDSDREQGLTSSCSASGFTAAKSRSSVLTAVVSASLTPINCQNDR
jgi:hypothetical protein